MSRLLASRATVAAGLALALAACVIGPKPDDPLNGGDGTSTLDAGGDTSERGDIGAVPSGDAGLANDAPASGNGDAAADAADASDANDASDGAGAPDALTDGADAAASDGNAEAGADGATDGGAG
jgi:hypothetical protein